MVHTIDLTPQDLQHRYKCTKETCRILHRHLLTPQEVIVRAQKDAGQSETPNKASTSQRNYTHITDSQSELHKDNAGGPRRLRWKPRQGERKILNTQHTVRKRQVLK
eukprot:jgi/Botrbrau1/7824/Bobra.9_2s0005.1